MNVREWLNNNSAVATIAAVVILVLAISFIIWQNTGSGVSPIESFYYYDMSSGQITVASSDEIPPFEREGAPLVRARLFACGDCPSGLEGATPDQLAQQQVSLAWIERYPPRARQALLQARDAEGPVDPEVMERQMMAHEALQVSRPGASRWVAQMSEQGMNLMQPNIDCGDERIRECFPGR